jgi:uncharacterized protein
MNAGGLPCEGIFMKKIGQFILCIVPLFCVFLIQFGVMVFATIICEAIEFYNCVDQSGMEEEVFRSSLCRLRDSVYLVGILAIAALICILAFGIWYRHIENKGQVKGFFEAFTKQNVIYIVLLGLGLQVGISIILNLITTIKPGYFANYGELLNWNSFESTVLVLIYLVLIAPLSEEIIFRGVILEKAKKIMPVMVANLFQAILFGIYHMNIFQGIYGLVIGMFLGIVYIKFKSLYISIFLHIVISLSGFFLINIEKMIFYNTGIVLIMLISAIILVVSATIKLLRITKI